MNTVTATSTGTVPVIELASIHRRYRMGEEIIHALNDVSVTIGRNEYAAIMGASGSGKSTLMNVIGCLDTPDEGAYRLGGELVSSMSDRQLAQVRNREIGFVFQTFNLLTRMTALGNVEVPLVYAGVRHAERQRRARQALVTVGLADRMLHKPAEMSGGQRQRVAIARALVTHPRILLADEPTGNLDSATSQDIMKLFNDLHEAGHTLVMVTHERDVAAHARRILHMTDGRIIGDETMEESS